MANRLNGKNGFFCSIASFVSSSLSICPVMTLQQHPLAMRVMAMQKAALKGRQCATVPAAPFALQNAQIGHPEAGIAKSITEGIDGGVHVGEDCAKDSIHYSRTN